MIFELHIRDDGTVFWPGVDTGITTVAAHNPKRKIIALKIAGQSTWTGSGKIYGAAHYTVYEYKILGRCEKGKYGAKSAGIVIQVDELSGVLQWNARSKSK